jgi:hypothetical protein
MVYYINNLVFCKLFTVLIQFQKGIPLQAYDLSKVLSLLSYSSPLAFSDSTKQKRTVIFHVLAKLGSLEFSYLHLKFDLDI